MEIIEQLIKSILQLEKQVQQGQKLSEPERKLLEYIVTSCWGYVEAATTATSVLKDNSKIAGREITMQEL